MKQGEPLLHPKFCEFAQYVRRKRPDIELAVHTNATLLDKRKADILAECLDFVTFSIHTSREERYKKIHGGNCTFKEVISNCSYFAQMCHNSGRRVKLYVDYVRQSENEDESRAEVVETFNRLLPGVNIGIHSAFSFQNAIEEGYTKASRLIDEVNLPRCFFPWAAMSICHDGNVSYCITEPREKVSLGDLTKQSLKEVWNNQHFQLFRRNMKEGQYEDLRKKEIYCIHCSWLWSLERIHNHLMLERDKIANKSLIDVIEGNQGDYDQLCKAYVCFLNGEIDRAENEVKKVCLDKAGYAQYLIGIINDYRALWKHRNDWIEACSRNEEDYHGFNKVLYWE